MIMREREREKEKLREKKNILKNQRKDNSYVFRFEENNVLFFFKFYHMSSFLRYLQ